MALTLLLGGARSGKSALAERLAARWDGPVTVVVTAEARDAEMAERIRRHRARRPAGWRTVEEPVGRRARSAAAAAAARAAPTVVVSNEVGAGIVPADALSRRYRDLLGEVNAVWAAA